MTTASLTPVSDDAESRDGEATDVALADVVDELPDAQIVIDGHGRILRVNDRLEALFGYDNSELLGQSVEVLVPERARVAHSTAREIFATEPRIRSMGLGLDLVGRHRDGTEIPVDIRLTPLTTKAGTWVVAAIRDDTARRLAEKRREVITRADEAHRISVDLADTVIHHLFGTGLRLQTLLPRAGAQVHDELTEIVATLDDIIREVRSAIFSLAK